MVDSTRTGRREEQGKILEGRDWWVDPDRVSRTVVGDGSGGPTEQTPVTERGL